MLCWFLAAHTVDWDNWDVDHLASDWMIHTGGAGFLGTWCSIRLEECQERSRLHVGLEEQRCRRRAWQVSQTLTGLGEAGSGSSLSEQLLQNISPQFLQWCWWGTDRIIVSFKTLFGFVLLQRSDFFEPKEPFKVLFLNKISSGQYHFQTNANTRIG